MNASDLQKGLVKDNLVVIKIFTGSDFYIIFDA